MSLKFKDTEYLRATKHLIDNEIYLKYFKSYGVSVETLRMFRVGLDDEDNVIMPILNNSNRVQGTLVIYNIMQNGGMYSFSCSGLVGNPYSKGRIKELTIAKNIIDVFLLWQLGVENPVMVSDRETMPYMNRYRKFTFVDAEDSLIDSVWGEVFTYEIKDLVNYLEMYKTLPEVKRIEDKGKPFELSKMPMIMDGKVFMYTNLRGNVVDSSGKFYATVKVRDFLRRFTYEDEHYYFDETAYFIPRSWNGVKNKESLEDLYNDIFRLIYTENSFLAEDQCKLMALYVLYQWSIAHRHPLVTYLHIITPSMIQLSSIIKTLKNVAPTLAFGPGSNCYVLRQENFPMLYKKPIILIDSLKTRENMDIGPKILITEESINMRKTKDLKKLTYDEKARLRHRLVDLCLTSTFSLEEDQQHGLYSFFMPFHQVGLKVGIKQKELKRLFNTVCVSAQRAFKGIDKDDYVLNHSTILEDLK